MAFLTRQCWASLIAAALLTAAPASADETLQLHEPEIKAGLIYNFLKYIDWPAADVAGPDMKVCIFGNDPFADYLKPMRERSVNRKNIVLRIIHNAGELAGCHLLFVTREEKGSWSELRTALKGKSILTVADFDGFTSSGGMVEFGQKDSHIKVDLNTDATEAAQLKVQDRLLKLVTPVHGGAP